MSWEESITLRAAGLGAVFGAAVVGVLAGSLYLGYKEKQAKQPATPAQVEESFKQRRMGVAVYDVSSGGDRELYTIDINQDGKVDAFQYFGTADWYTPDWNGRNSKDALPMTPEIRDLATKIAHEQVELSKMLSAERARQTQSK